MSPPLKHTSAHVIFLFLVIAWAPFIFQQNNPRAFEKSGLFQPRGSGISFPKRCCWFTLRTKHQTIFFWIFEAKSRCKQSQPNSNFECNLSAKKNAPMRKWNLITVQVESEVEPKLKLDVIDEVDWAIGGRAHRSENQTRKNMPDNRNWNWIGRASGNGGGREVEVERKGKESGKKDVWILGLVREISFESVTLIQLLWLVLCWELPGRKTNA